MAVCLSGRGLPSIPKDLGLNPSTKRKKKGTFDEPSTVLGNTNMVLIDPCPQDLTM